MDEAELIKKCNKIKKRSVTKIQKIDIDYEDFKSIYKILLNQFSDKGVLMILEKTATLTFYNYENIRFIIKSKKLLIIDDFVPYIEKFKIIGAHDHYNTKKVFLEDIRNNLKKMIILSIVYFIVYNSTIINQESLTKLNDHLVDITNIFIASFFVFIAFFNGDKKKIIELYRKGNCDKFNCNDKYIFKLSISALVLVVLSNGLINFHFGYEKTILLVSKLGLQQYINERSYITLRYIKYNISFVLTWISIVFLVICFDSILNYYLNKIRNNYFIDAFEEEIKEKQ